MAKKTTGCSDFFAFLIGSNPAAAQALDAVCPNGLDQGQSICSSSYAADCTKRCTPCIACANTEGECTARTADGNSCSTCESCIPVAECISPGFFEAARNEDRANKVKETQAAVQKAQQELAEKQGALAKLQRELSGLTGTDKRIKEQEIESKESEIEQQEAQLDAATQRANAVSGSTSAAITTAVPSVLVALFAAVPAVLV